MSEDIIVSIAILSVRLNRPKKEDYANRIYW
jgi:hypothetical protein